MKGQLKEGRDLGGVMKRKHSQPFLVVMEMDYQLNDTVKAKSQFLLLLSVPLFALRSVKVHT
ncbi:hypothetical protein EYF80_030128 [Liparis tanakae]|uniref:Uncharacterized protein n=1 Tax=Liparis tanakae TaxID=230148 RepID=A0A4Z2H423_9TELE|nr:hypothetical protein EYF80_030128 [Liparis tanakae]